METQSARVARLTRLITLAALVAAVGACGLPRPGPNKSEIFSAESLEGTETQLVLVDERVTRAIAVPYEYGFPKSFVNAGSATSDKIRPGDVLSIRIFENVDDGVLNRGDATASTLDPIQVDESGSIFIPYAGRIRAEGNTPEQLRQVITSKLSDLTPEPQVLVRRAPGDGATVSVLGDGIAAQGVYPLARSSSSLMEMLATAGGVVAPPETRVIVLRNKTKGKIWFEDVYDRPEYDIALRSGDRIIVERDPRVFTLLGATGTQANVPFGMRQPSALEAVAEGGGLDSTTADPTGLFVIRKQGAKLTNELLNRSDLSGPQSVVYVINLTEPNGLPLARDFDIRDGDTIYVTEAPFVQWTKTLNAITGTASTVNTLQDLGE